MKHDSGNPKDAVGRSKAPLRLVPPVFKVWVAEALQDGAAKYGEYNFRRTRVRLSVYIEAAMRHLDALLDGEDCAEDSHLPHEAHAAACMAIILDCRENGKLIDDRPPKGKAAEVMKRVHARHLLESGKRRKRFHTYS